jgi:type I restriction enzyme, S subunit
MLDDLTELPEGWSLTSLEEISHRITKGTTPTSLGFNFSDSGVLFVKVESLFNKRIKHSSCAFIDLITDQALSRSRLETNDVLFSIAGTLGRVAIVQDQDLPANTNQAISIIRLIKPILPEYIVEVLSSHILESRIQEGGRGVGLQNLNLKQVSEFEIPLPPLNEQKRIVAKIEELRSHTQAARNAIAHIPKLLEQFRQSVLAAAFRGDLTAEWRSENPDVEPAEVLLQRIRKERRDRWESTELEKMRSAGKMPKDDKWKSKYKEPESLDEKEVDIFVDELPEGWLLLSAEQCTSMITDGEHATPERTDQGVYLLSARNVLDGRISLEKVDYISEETHLQLEKRFKIEEGDVFLSCSGSVGRSCTVPKSLRCSLVRSVAILKPLSEMGHYISLSIRSPRVQSQIESKKTQTAQANIFQGRIKVLAIPVAPLKEQKAILDIVQESFISIDRIEQQYKFIKTELDRLDRSILAKAFKGELVPQDPTDEPAIVLLERIRNDRASQPKPAKTKRKKA